MSMINNNDNKIENYQEREICAPNIPTNEILSQKPVDDDKLSLLLMQNFITNSRNSVITDVKLSTDSTMCGINDGKFLFFVLVTPINGIL
jgi:hypothetical protein